MKAINNSAQKSRFTHAPLPAIGPHRSNTDRMAYNSKTTIIRS